MAVNLTQEDNRIFRITHRDNLAWILDNGMHAPSGGKFDDNHRNIGNVDLIDKRTRRQVPVQPGGTLADYVPFYFTPCSMMMYNIHTGYNGVDRVPNEEILIFVSSLTKVAEQGRRFVFTDRHAYLRMAEYFTDLSQLDRIDWSLLQSRNFKHDPDDPGKTERYQAEALVWKSVPLEALLGVCCYTEDVRQLVESEIKDRALEFKVAVRRGWYF